MLILFKLPEFSCISKRIKHIFTYLSVLSPNAGKSGKNADQNNSEYGLFLRREHVEKNEICLRSFIPMLK